MARSLASWRCRNFDITGQTYYHRFKFIQVEATVQMGFAPIDEAIGLAGLTVWLDAGAPGMVLILVTA
jgi:hypothetical protein